MNRILIVSAWSFFAFVFASGPRAESALIVGVDRLGQFQPAGTLLRFDSNDPGHATVVGNTGIDDIGAMDMYQGQVWAASSQGGILSFYTIDVDTAQATYVSSAGARSESMVFGGSFDSEGRFWVTDMQTDTLSAYSPWTGQLLTSVPIDPALAIPGIEFVGNTLYAVVKDPAYPGRFGTLDPLTGTFTPIGPALSAGGSNGLDYDPVSQRMFVTFSTGSATGPDSRLYWIDPATGAAASLGDVIPRATMDAIAVIPEPATVFLMAFGGLAVMRRRH